jgi:hypothetical protein
VGVQRRSRAGADGEADLDVREDQPDIGQSALRFGGSDLLVEVESPVIGDAESLDLWRCCFDPREVFLERIVALELVI